MAEDRSQDAVEDNGGDLQEQVSRKAARRLRAQQEEERGIVFWLGMFGLVGWSVAIPALLGTALGLWLDRRWPDALSWTLTGLIIGTVIGCFNAWYWIKGANKHE